MPVGVRVGKYTSAELPTPFTAIFNRSDPANTISGFLYTANQHNNRCTGEGIDIALNASGLIVAAVTSHFSYVIPIIFSPIIAKISSFYNLFFCFI